MNIDRKKIIDWYEQGNGKTLINSYLSSQATFINDNYLIAYNTCTENTGVYKITFNDVPIYIGESGELAFRLLTHSYNIFTGSTNWGITSSEILQKRVELGVKILENKISNQKDRKQKENEAICNYKPLLQYKSEKYYPSDKAKKDRNGRWMKREEIPNDWCLKKEVRTEVVLNGLNLWGN